jgi:hypothetical protein
MDKHLNPNAELKRRKKHKELCLQLKTFTSVLLFFIETGKNIAVAAVSNHTNMYFNKTTQKKP